VNCQYDPQQLQPLELCGIQQGQLHRHRCGIPRGLTLRMVRLRDGWENKLWLITRIEIPIPDYLISFQNFAIL